MYEVYFYFRDFLRFGFFFNCRFIDEKVDGFKLMEIFWIQSWFISRVFSIDERKILFQVENKFKIVGEVVSLIRVKCLVLMITFKDVRINGFVVTLVFVEFEMIIEGFGCLYFLSIVFRDFLYFLLLVGLQGLILQLLEEQGQVYFVLVFQGKFFNYYNYCILICLQLWGKEKYVCLVCFQDV